MKDTITHIATDVIELASMVDKLASENEALHAQIQVKPQFDTKAIAAAMDKCASAGVISQKEKAGFAARLAQEPEFALLLVEKTAERLADRVSPMGSPVGQSKRAYTDPYDAEFGS